MMPTSSGRAGPARRWPKVGCLVAAVAIGVLVVGGGIITGVAFRQIRSEAPETRQLVRELPAAAAIVADETVPEVIRAPGRVEVNISIAQLLVVPAAVGEPIRVEANYDPRYYELDQDSEDHPGGGWTYRLRFAPAHSRSMALFRIKLGGAPPRIRIALPLDVPLVLTGEVHGAFAAMELGGLRIEALEMTVSGGAASVSFQEPLGAPMDRLSLIGNKGSIEVTGLGNASPRTALLEQRFGELDLDLRGAWLRDAEIQIDAEIAGGSLWLPDDVVVEGLEGRFDRPGPVSAGELPTPRLRLAVTGRSGRLVVVD